MQKIYLHTCILFFIVTLSTVVSSCQSKSDNENAESSQHMPIESSEGNESVDSNEKESNHSLVEGNWSIEYFTLQDEGTESQKVATKDMSDFFVNEQHAGIRFDDIIGFTSVRIKGEWEVNDDEINVSGVQYGGFGMISLNQQFKILNVNSTHLTLLTLSGIEMPESGKEAMNVAIANGGPLGYRNIVIYLKRLN